MNLRSPVVIATFAAVAAGCTNDLPAPDNYTPTSQGSESDTSVDGAIECTDLPAAAVGAEYAFLPDVTVDDPAATWSAPSLPEGLVIDPTTGEITGVPTMEGPATFDVVVTTMAAESQIIMCDIDVRGQLTVDNELVVGAAPFCLRPGGLTLQNLRVEGTGDDTPITCSSNGGNGNGTVPAGVSVNPDTCEIEGSVTEQRFGTWTFIVRGEQSGAEVFVPYCVTNDSNDGYAMTIAHSGLEAMGQDGTLVPILRRFNPDAAIAVGGGGDPRFEVISPSICDGGSCSFRFEFRINSSPFDADSLSLNPAELFRDENDNPVGFSHELSIDTANRPVEEAFRDRPFTVNIDLNYCLAPDEAACAAGAPFNNNADGALEVSILMMPQ